MIDTPEFRHIEGSGLAPDAPFVETTTKPLDVLYVESGHLRIAGAAITEPEADEVAE